MSKLSLRLTISQAAFLGNLLILKIIVHKCTHGVELVITIRNPVLIRLIRCKISIHKILDLLKYHNVNQVINFYSIVTLKAFARIC